MRSLCSLNMNSTKLSADTYEDLKVTATLKALYLYVININLEIVKQREQD